MPEGLAEAEFLLRTGWTHAEYEATPNEVVERMILLMNAKAEVEHQRYREASGNG